MLGEHFPRVSFRQGLRTWAVAVEDGIRRINYFLLSPSVMVNFSC